MNLACQLCKGACCESIFIYYHRMADIDRPWFAYHGAQDDIGVELPCRCSKLSPEGACTVYEHRPYACHIFQVGGKGCREAIARRRPAHQREIVQFLEMHNAVKDAIERSTSMEKRNEPT